MESLRLGGTHRTERLEFLCLIPSVAELSLEQLVFLRVQILEPLPPLPVHPLPRVWGFRALESKPYPPRPRAAPPLRAPAQRAPGAWLFSFSSLFKHN